MNLAMDSSETLLTLGASLISLDADIAGTDDGGAKSMDSNEYRQSCQGHTDPG